ncbi:MAG TPA: PEP-CTERM sorting domain-containing protein [Rhodocyclaceae bacterium]|nr:PEP-CTERM sorting domain-containing protein [Rhodocyclaceae bacterium]
MVLFAGSISVEQRPFPIRLFGFPGPPRSTKFTSEVFSAHAALWNFSYTTSPSDTDPYDDPDASNVVTGSFTGDEDGLYVRNLANVSVFINGNPLTGNGNLAVQGNEQLIYDNQQTEWIIPPAVASRNLALNNFVFTEFPNYGGRGFVIYNDSRWDGTDVEVWMGPYKNDGDLPGVQERWTLTRMDVSEPGTLTLLAMGLALVGARRRRSMDS